MCSQPRSFLPVYVALQPGAAFPIGGKASLHMACHGILLSCYNLPDGDCLLKSEFEVSSYEITLFGGRTS